MTAMLSKWLISTDDVVSAAGLRRSIPFQVVRDEGVISMTERAEISRELLRWIFVEEYDVEYCRSRSTVGF